MLWFWFYDTQTKTTLIINRYWCLFEFMFSFIIIGYLIIYDFITIYPFIFPFLYSFLVLNSCLLHFPTFISSSDLFLFFNFLIPISPAAFYYFKSYPYWPSKPPRRRPKPSEVLGDLKSLFSLLLCQLQFYGFSWNSSWIWMPSKLLKLQWTFHLFEENMASPLSSLFSSSSCHE